MSAFDSYLFERRLPENGKLITIHNYITLLNVLAISFNYLIQYLSPTSKESFYYKLIAHSQGASIFAFCLIWTVLFKAIPHLDFHFFYCEGYYYRIGITCAGSYVLVCITFGSYATSTVAGYMYRLYLLVDHNHILKVPHFFPASCGIMEFVYTVISSLTFYIGCSEFNPKSIPLNLTEEQIEYFKERSVISYTVKTPRERFYPILFIFLIVVAFLMALQALLSTVRTVQKKQSMMSAGTTKHHLRVLKILTIQASVNTSISCCAPIAIVLSLFVPVNSYIIYAALILMGVNSMLHSLLTIYLNPATRKTVVKLFKIHVLHIRVAVSTVNTSNKLSTVHM